MIISQDKIYNFDIWKFQFNKPIQILVFIYLFALYFQYNIIPYTKTIYLYPENELEIDDVCALSGKTMRILDQDLIETPYLYLSEHCGKSEKCYETEEGIFQCGEKILLQKIGDDCGINEECFTGLCNYGKCSSISNDGDCTVENDPDNPEKVCNPGHWCYEYDILNHLYKCVPYIGEGEYYDELNGKLCGIGTRPFADATLFEKCTKIGSQEEGVSSPDPIMCKSGFSVGYENDITITDDTSKFKCFSVKDDAKCEYSSADSKYYCKPIVEGLDLLTVQLEVECYEFNNIHVCPYSKGKQNSFKQYISKLNSININDVYGDEHKYHLIGYGDNDLSQAYLKYLYYDDLYAMGILDDNGNVRDSKEDEWEFFWRFNYSKYINFSCFFLILLIFL